MSAHFGLDISSSTIKVVEVKGSESGFELVAFGEVKTPAAINTKNPADKKFVYGAIKKLLGDAKINAKNVHIAVPESEAYTRVVEMPILDDKELKSALRYESEQYIPVPIEEVYLEHEVIYRPPKDTPEAKMKVLIVAAKKVIVDGMVDISQDLGLTPLILETALLAGVRGVKQQLAENSLLVDIGNNSTDIAIMLGGTLRQTSSVKTAGEALTRSIMQNLALPEQQARQYKHLYGLETDQLEGKVGIAMQQPMTMIVNHIVKSIRFAQQQNEGQIQEVVLSGGTALLPNLSRYLVDKLNTEVVLANPFQKCNNKDLPQQLVAAAPRFAAAIGLALRK